MHASRFKQLPHRRHFLSRLGRNAVISGSLLMVSLAIGVFGYHQTMGLGFYDSLLNASMILGGMGPVNIPTTNMAKLFSSAYAIYSGIAFLTGVGFFFVPILHRIMHQFHIEIEER